MSVILLPNTRELMKVRDRIYLFNRFKCLVTQLMQQETRGFLKWPLNRVCSIVKLVDYTWQCLVDKRQELASCQFRIKVKNGNNEICTYIVAFIVHWHIVKNWTGLDWIGFVKHGFGSEMMDK